MNAPKRCAEASLRATYIVTLRGLYTSKGLFPVAFAPELSVGQVAFLPNAGFLNEIHVLIPTRLDPGSRALTDGEKYKRRGGAELIGGFSSHWCLVRRRSITLNESVNPPNEMGRATRLRPRCLDFF